MSSLDVILNETYKMMCGVDSMMTDDKSNTILEGDLTINSNLYISGNTILNKNTIFKSSINISNKSILFGNTTLLANLNVSSNSIFNNDITIPNTFVNKTIINNNLYVSNYTILSSKITINTNLNISNFTIFENNIIPNNIAPINTILNLNASTINIGNGTTIIDIKGTSSYVATNQVKIIDKIISLNLNSSNSGPADIGYLTGIQLLGTNGNGFINTNSDALRYLIKAPTDNNTNYINMLDTNNNFKMSGSSLFNNNVTLLSSINISGTTNINNNVTLLSNIKVSGNTVITTSLITSQLNVMGISYVLGDMYLPQNLNIIGNSQILGLTTLMSNLYVNNNSNFGLSTLLSTINVSGKTNLQGASLSSNLNISGQSNLLGSVSLNSVLNIVKQCNFIGNSSINSNLNLSGNSTILNTSINSTLNISSYTILKGNVVINSDVNIANNFNLKLYQNLDNTVAKKSGIPVWGWYRTGGICCIRLNDVPPTIYFSGNSIINLVAGSTYTDPGVYGLDYLGNSTSVYLVALLSGPSNLLSSNRLLNNTITEVPQVSTLQNGIYKICYSTIDRDGLIGHNHRIINIDSLSTTNLPTITLLGGSTFNSNSSTIFNDPGAFAVDYLGNTINVYLTSIVAISTTTNLLEPNILISGLVPPIPDTNMLIDGSYTLTYEAMDASGNVGYNYRTLKIGPTSSSISYFFQNGGLGPLTNNYTINGDFTMEAWIYIKNYDQDISVFDSRSPSKPNCFGDFIFDIYKWPGSDAIINFMTFDSTGQYYIIARIFTNISINSWAHVVVMYKNNIFYAFYNGILGTLNGIGPVYPIITNTINININSGTSPIPNNTICQPLIRTGAHYPITGFTPQWNLTPSSYSNVLFWLQNGVEVISGKTMPIVGTVVKTTINGSPFLPQITLVNYNIFTMLVGNSYYDSGATAVDYLGNSLSVLIISFVSGTTNLLSRPLSITGTSTLIPNTSTLPIGTYKVTYQTTDSNGNVALNYRTINIIQNELLTSATFNSSMTFSLSQTTFNTFTIEAWVNGDLSGPNNLSGTNRLGIISDSTCDVGLYFLYISNVTNTNGTVNGTGIIKPQYFIHMGGSSSFSNTIFRSNTWTHIAVTLDSGNISYYINNILSFKKTYSGSINISNVIANNFPGVKLMNLRIWNIARTQSQIINNRFVINKSQLDSIDGLLHWFPLISDSKDLISNNLIFSTNVFDWNIFDLNI